MLQKLVRIMETDIIIDGLKKAESKHGVRYMRFVGDGDSSVHPALLENVPRWGRYIKKLECANHTCKCYRGSLENWPVTILDTRIKVGSL